MASIRVTKAEGETIDVVLGEKETVLESLIRSFQPPIVPQHVYDDRVAQHEAVVSARAKVQAAIAPAPKPSPKPAEKPKARKRS